MESAALTRETPDVLVLPTMTEFPTNPAGEPDLNSTVEVMLVPIEAEDGGERLVALAFSTVVHLVEALGGEQPWLAVPTNELEGLLEGSGAAAVLLDPELPEGFDPDGSGE